MRYSSGLAFGGRGRFGGTLGGSWVLISRVISLSRWLITIVTLILTPLLKLPMNLQARTPRLMFGV